MTKTFNYKLIKEEYGINLLDLVRKFEHISKTKGRYQSHLCFYLQCKHEELTAVAIQKIRSTLNGDGGRYHLSMMYDKLIGTKLDFKIPSLGMDDGTVHQEAEEGRRPSLEYISS